jgi:carbamoyl-phosphate synthase large subunit
MERARRSWPSEHPILVDKFLEERHRGGCRLPCDGTRTVIGGVMQHIEEAGIHSGDSACVMPPHLARRTRSSRRSSQQTRALALELNVSGLMNIQFAVPAPGSDDQVYVLEGKPAGQPDRAVRVEGHRPFRWPASRPW